MSLIINPHRFPIVEGFYEDIVDAGLTGDLRFCLDVAAASCFDGTSQTLTDMSGNGNDFFRGADVNSSTDDPAFVGSAGDLLAGTYLSFDGGDFLRLAQSNPSWVNNIAKDNAAWSFLLWSYRPNLGGSDAYMGTHTTGGGSPGFSLTSNNVEKMILIVDNDAGNALAPGTHATAFNIGAWNMFGVSVDESVGASGGFYYLNGVEALFTSTYATPTTSDATFTLEIGARGNAAQPMESTSRIGGAMFWGGTTALTPANFDTLWTAMKGRYSL